MPVSLLSSVHSVLPGDPNHGCSRATPAEALRPPFGVDVRAAAPAGPGDADADAVGDGAPEEAGAADRFDVADGGTAIGVGQRVAAHTEEAAIVDGATISQRFWYVTLPALRPVLSVLFLLRFIWTFNKFDDVFLLTGGAAGTEVITVKIFEWLTGRANVGAAAALGIVLAVILLVLVAIYFRFFYEEEETA